jgi:hypothetical protein
MGVGFALRKWTASHALQASLQKPQALSLSAFAAKPEALSSFLVQTTYESSK